MEDVCRLFIDHSSAILDKDGKKAGYTRSIWTMINLNAHEPADLLTLHGGSIVDYVCNESCPIEKPSCIEMTAGKPSAKLTAKCGNIDTSGYTNSIRYIGHILGLFLIQLYVRKQIQRFEMAYMAESCYGDELFFSEEEVNEDEYHVEIEKNDYRAVYHARVRFV